MYKICFLLLIGIILSIGNTFAQEILPKFTIKELDGKISISWRNNYPKEVKGINIQRSYDSIKRFSTIATVPNPKIIANGFIDKHPPYNKMYYRLFIVFDSGLYVFSESQRPYTDSLPGITETEDNAVKKPGYTRKNSLPALVTEKKIQGSVLNDSKSVKKPFEKLKSKENPVLPPKETIFIYPSKRIYTGKDNNIVINLPEIKSNKYVMSE